MERTGKMQAALIEIDKYSEFISKYHLRDQSLLKFVLKSVVIELAESHDAKVWTEWIAADRLGILCMDEEDTMLYHKMKLLSHDLIEWVDKHLQFQITIGVGTCYEEVNEVALSYEEAVSALKYKTVLGRGRYISYLDVHSKETGSVYHHLDTIRSLAECIKHSNEAWISLFEQLFIELKDTMVTRDEVQIVMNYLNHHLHQSVRDLAKEYSDHWETHTYPQILDIANQAETLEEIQLQYYQLLYKEVERLREIREKRNGHSLIQQIKRYIEDQFMNQELSLNMISDHFQLSTKYVSQLFKDEMGERFIDYLSRLRVERAKKLLVESEDSIQDIAFQVGYAHALSFIRMFKKNTLSTPGEYRKRMTER